MRCAVGRLNFDEMSPAAKAIAIPLAIPAIVAAFAMVIVVILLLVPSAVIGLIDGKAVRRAD